MIWASGFMAGCGLGMWLREDDGQAYVFLFFAAALGMAAYFGSAS